MPSLLPRPALQFAKNLPGAQIRFQPDNLAAYTGYPWDVRISLGDAPLDDAFYFTVQEYGATERTVREILQDYALNRTRRGELDVERYPELPHAQEELVQYWEAAARGALDLRVCVNHRPRPEPIDLDSAVQPLLCSCAFDDGSFDYLVLDLVFVLDPAEMPEADRLRARDRLGLPYLLLLLDYRAKHGVADPILSATSSALARMLEELERQGRTTSHNGAFRLTPAGAAEAAALGHETRRLIKDYEPFSSVAVYPPALGILNGFDVRLQIMEQDGVDLERAILLLTLDAMADPVFTAPGWEERFESGQAFADILSARAYQTGFTPDVLATLRALSGASS